MTLGKVFLFVMAITLPLISNAEGISAYALIGNPQYWHGKHITVSGYFVADRMSLLYLNSESMKYRERNDSLMLSASRDFIKSFEHMSGRRISFTGKFVADSYLGASGIIEVDEIASEKLISSLYGPPQKVKDK